MDEQIVQVIAFFKNAFSLVLALALAEAFKQFVTDRAKPDEKIIQWNKLLSLISFLLLIFPFYQGILRYFSYEYGDVHKLPQPYSIFIMFDSIAFMIEAALFFIMSRSLAPAHWLTYYWSVLVLLWVDSVWGLAAAFLHNIPIEWWIYLNFIFGTVALVMILARKLCNRLTDDRAVIIGFIVVALRTGLDYYKTWGFYFPS